MPDAPTLWSLAVLVVGGTLYLLVSRTSTAPAIAKVRSRPGWIARRRARGGIKHRHERVGYASATRSVHLSLHELAGHGLTVGGLGSGKTTFLQLLVEASAGRVPCVLVDPKGSPTLEATVRAHGGQVWTLDGHVPADLLDPRPWQVPDLLLEAEDYSADARAYRDAAHQRALWAAWSLALDGRPMDLSDLRQLLGRETLIRALEPHRHRDGRIGEWLERLHHQHGGIEDSGARCLDRALGTLLDGVALRGSLRSCPEALRREDVLETNGLVLFSLDAAEYPHATRKIASWILLGMARVVRHTANAASTPTALLLADEVGALGASARHLRGLVGRARESGLAVVLASQGLSDLQAVEPGSGLVDQVLQDMAWQLVFRQGSPHDARLVEALFGQAWTEDVTRYSDGRTSWRNVERPRVPIDEWLNGLHPGDAWLRVAPVDRGWRQQRVRVALPRSPRLSSERGIVRVERRYTVESPGDTKGTARDTEQGTGGKGTVGSALRLSPCQPPDKRIAFYSRRVGVHWIWKDGAPVNQTTGYPRLKVDGKYVYVHILWWEHLHGPRPIGADGELLTVDHTCEWGKRCVGPACKRLLSRGGNTDARWERNRG